jgi:cobalt/nickel transport system permease protein
MGANSFFFLLYLAAVGLLVTLHHTLFFGIAALILTLCSPKTAWRTFKAILFFNISVTLGYLFQLAVLHEGSWDFILLFNLRVFDITFLTLYIVPKLNVAEALSFSRTLQFLYLASLSQIGSFRRTYGDFVMALKSRTVKPLADREKRDFIGSMLYFFTKKALNQSKERAQALRARGFFDQAR